MLVLSRKASESIQIGDGIVVKVIEIQKNRVKIGISAPNEVPIHRSELLEIEIEPDEVGLAGDSFRDSTAAHDVSSNHSVMHQVVLSAIATGRVAHFDGRRKLMSSRGFTTDASVLTIADHQLQSCIEDALRDSGYGALRSIAVRAHEGMVLLDGTVTTYYLKQFAQSLVLQIDGVQQLHNRIEVI